MSYKEFVKRTVTLILIFALMLALWHLRQILLLSFLSVVIALTLSMPVIRLEQMGFKRGYAVAISIGSTLFIMVLMLILLLPPTVRQMVSLAEDLPTAVDETQANYESFREDYESLQSILPDTAGTSIRDSLGLSDEPGESFQLGGLSGISLPTLANIGNSILALVANLVVVFIVAIYLLVDPLDYAQGTTMLVPSDYQSRFFEVMLELRRTLTAWLTALSLSISITFVLVYVGLGLVWGVPNAFALAVIAGAATIIPNLGVVIPIIPIAIFTLADDPSKLVFVIITYLFIQQVESNLISPILVKRQMNIPVGLILVFQLVAGTLFGFLGVLLAVPLLGVLITLVRELYVYDMLGQRSMTVKLEENDEGALEVTKMLSKPAEPMERPPDTDTPAESEGVIIEPSGA